MSTRVVPFAEIDDSVIGSRLCALVHAANQGVDLEVAEIARRSAGEDVPADEAADVITQVDRPNSEGNVSVHTGRIEYGVAEGGSITVSIDKVLPPTRVIWWDTETDSEAARLAPNQERPATHEMRTMVDS